MFKRIYIKIHGYVIGVGFRYYIWQIAQKFGVLGYVKNCSDGTVEIEAEGQEERLKDLLEWAKQGPSQARIDKLEFKWLDNKHEFNSFNIRY